MRDQPNQSLRCRVINFLDSFAASSDKDGFPFPRWLLRTTSVEQAAHQLFPTTFLMIPSRHDPLPFLHRLLMVDGKLRQEWLLRNMTRHKRSLLTLMQLGHPCLHPHFFLKNKREKQHKREEPYHPNLVRWILISPTMTQQPPFCRNNNTTFPLGITMIFWIDLGSVERLKSPLVPWWEWRIELANLKMAVWVNLVESQLSGFWTVSWKR